MYFTPNDEESMTYLTIANVTLLTSLFKNGFLESDYYENMQWRMSPDNVRIIKDVLKQRKLDNPSMMLMELYGLFVLPKELLGSEYEKLCKNEFNNLIICKQKEIQTTYRNEEAKNLQSINYFRHIRNAISHARYEFYTDNGCSYVKFMDNNSKSAELFSVSILTEDISVLADFLCMKLMEFLNNRVKQYKNNVEI